MENKPRTWSDIECEYAHSHGIVSSLSDLLFILGSDRFDELGEETISQATFALHWETQKLNKLFQESLGLLFAASKKQ